MKILAFIAVRVGSSRLPEKALLLIRSKRVIDHVIDRAKLIKGIEDVVVCTSDQPEDDILEKIATEHGVFCFRGSLKDKLARFLGAADKFGADFFANIDADDPLFDPGLIDLAIGQLQAEPCDIVKSPAGLACGAFTFLISVKSLREVCKTKNTDDTEMYEVYFLETGQFKVKDLKVADPILFNDQVRLTLDYPEDLDFFKRVFDELEMDVNVIPLHKIMELLRQKPQIAEINISRHEDYLAKRAVMRQNVKLKV